MSSLCTCSLAYIIGPHKNILCWLNVTFHQVATHKQFGIVLLDGSEGQTSESRVKMTEGLLQQTLLSSSIDTCMENQTYRNFSRNCSMKSKWFHMLYLLNTSLCHILWYTSIKISHFFMRYLSTMQEGTYVVIYYAVSSSDKNTDFRT
jgi:hypothetical protein